MSFAIRRVVTGHDPQGNSIVAHDEMMTETVSIREGIEFHVAWASNELPVDNSQPDPAVPGGTIIPNGSVFRIIDYHPGVAPRMHRTESVDYAIVLSGEIDMELDSGTVKLRAGDVLVQRGTSHNWINNGSEVCRIAIVLLSAEPVKIGGSTLGNTG